MKFSVVICSCLLAWAESANMEVNIYRMRSVPDHGSWVGKLNSDEFRIDFPVPMNTDTLNLAMTLKLGNNSQTFTTSYCNDDMSTQEGALASIVRDSIMFKCPVAEVSSYEVPSKFNFDGNIGELSSEGLNSLDVTVSYPQRRGKNILFTAGYFISAA